MSEVQFSPVEQALIERLQNAPQPRLSSDKAAAIRHQMLASVDAGTIPPRTFLNSRQLLIIAVGLAFAIVVLVILILPQDNRTDENASPATVVPTSTIPTETVVPTMTSPVTAEATAAIHTETAIPTLQATQVTETPILQPSDVVDPAVLIEGPISEIDVNSIIIFGIVIQINDNTVLSDLQIGDFVRVEGQTIIIGETVMVNAITIVIVNIEETGGGSIEGGLPPSCKRSKKGKITCK